MSAAGLPPRPVLLWHTLRHLPPAQLAWLLRRRLLPRTRPRRIGAATLRGPVYGLQTYPPPLPELPPGQIVFLNQARAFDPAQVDWRAAEMPKLWRYNLHYFDFLHWPSWSAAQKSALIDGWIRANPPAQGDGWEPYPVALRAVNWLKWWLAGAATPDPAHRASLATQLDWLARNLEFELRANHLLKNACALIWGGLCLETPRAAGWLRTGLTLLLREADAQFLADGGHFERSPMYHALALQDLLEVLALIDALGDAAIPAAARARLAAQAGRALRFLATLCGAARRLPLFNDAAQGIAPAPAELIAFGERVLGSGALAAGLAHGTGAFELPATGYWGLHTGAQRLVIDCGPVGPDYQPGHAHCDTLSFELDVGGVPVIVDAGVHDYEDSEMRRYVRSTAAHNTLRVDGAEQSEVWGAFRVARRARPGAVEFHCDESGRVRFRGAHDGYQRLPGAVHHQREILVEGDRSWRIDDALEGRGRHRLESFLHFHPAVRLNAGAGGAFHAEAPGGLRLRLVPHGFDECHIERGWHCPEFGRREANAVLIGTASGELPLRCGFGVVREG
jgi:uncharacterized heparinase superfamily protein